MSTQLPPWKLGAAAAAGSLATLTVVKCNSLRKSPPQQKEVESKEGVPGTASLHVHSSATALAMSTQAGERATLSSMDGKYGKKVTREELGRCTWTLLHTLAAQYPEDPTRAQKRSARNLINSLTTVYPCKECAKHFKEVLRHSPPQLNSGYELAQWVCRAHNTVNRSIGKPIFNCERVDARWGQLDCGEGACSLEGRRPPVA
ncbi:hypothetical protein CYMTET_43667 [Cymbomonas tetramitiformis]|uniref:Sulfhydryl oxidase n=1 Tax=Cymbomonas tetramitiformis TaxID=36881 RepID=A0AAE0C1P9_9CHLO|nr:hypothetical protein CYMTET_43667 [Cymbomonas tetramitiformis]